MGIGAVIRDVEGEVLATLSALKDFITDPVIVEATAACCAALFCWELGYQRVELKGEALQMVQALRKEGCNLSKYGHIIEKARGILNGFCQLKVSHIR